MSKRAVLRRMIAGYEAIVCVVGLAFLPGIFRASFGSATVVGVLCIVAGVGAVLLWQNAPLGYRLCAVSEALRSVRVVSPLFTYYAVVGLDLTLGLQVFPAGMPGNSAAVGAGVWHQWFVGTSFIAYLLAPAQFWAVGANVVGVGVLLGLRAASREKTHHDGDPDGKRAGDVQTGNSYVLYRSTPEGGRYRVGVYPSSEAAERKREQLSHLPHTYWIEDDLRSSE
jgi:hypothetical protein